MQSSKNQFPVTQTGTNAGDGSARSRCSTVFADTMLLNDRR